METTNILLMFWKPFSSSASLHSYFFLLLLFIYKLFFSFSFCSFYSWEYLEYIYVEKCVAGVGIERIVYAVHCFGFIASFFLSCLFHTTWNMLEHAMTMPSHWLLVITLSQCLIHIMCTQTVVWCVYEVRIRQSAASTKRRNRQRIKRDGLIKWVHWYVAIKIITMKI